MGLPKKAKRKVLRYFRSKPTGNDSACHRPPLADCFPRLPLRDCCHAADGCQRLAASDCCPASVADCCSLVCPYRVAFSEPPSLLNLLLTYPFNSRWFVDPLLAANCKYHHQVILETCQDHCIGKSIF